MFLRFTFSVNHQTIMLRCSLCLLAIFCFAFSFAAEQLESPEINECEICKEVVKFAETFLEQNATQEEVEQFLEQLCHRLPIPESQCKDYVETYTPVVIHVLETKESPDTVCKQFSFCKEGNVVDAPELNTCFICKYILDYAEKYLTENSTEAEVESFLEGLCKYLPIPDQQCDDYIEGYTDIVLKYLESKETPEAICKQFGLCDATPLPKPESPEFGECTVCKLVLDYAEKFLVKNSTEAEVESFLEKLCNYLPHWQSSCDNLVEIYTPVVLKWLETEEDPATFCKQMGLCDTAVSSPQVDDCYICKLILDFAEKYLADNATEFEVESFLEGLCQYLPIPEQQCDNYIEQYTAVVIHFLESKESPDTICKQFGFCKESDASPLPVDDEEIVGECFVCKTVLKYAERYLTENSTEAEIASFLEKLCNYLPHFQNNCDNLVETYTPVLLKWLKIMENPETFCKQMGLCDTVVEAPQLDTCFICKLILDYAEKYLSKNSTEVEVEHFLESLCKHLPIPEQQCDDYIEGYTAIVIHYLETEESPEVVCKQFGYCKSSSTKLESNEPESEVIGECFVCKTVLKYAEKFLTKNSTEAEVESFLEKLCAYLPHFQNNCDNLVDTYTPVVLEWLKTMENPETFCRQMGLCTTVPEPVENILGECYICKLVLSYADRFLSKNSTEAEIESFLEKLCHFLPQLNGQQCDDIIEAYVPVIIHYLESAEDPKTLCKQMKMCSEKAKPESVPEIEGCMICKLVIGYAETYLSKNSTVHDVTNFVEKLCRYVPALEGTCDTLVDDYVPILMKWLESEEDPETFCKQVGICSSSLSSASRCDLCKSIILYAEYFLGSDSTAADVAQFLKKICSHLPEYENMCEDFVEEFTPLVIHWLETKASPEKLCKVLHFCS
eukprot:GCRY01000540.1.p1 GENE.GCRY01000540.1~~GCRY01000540.1.p1  ORF type:complete len:900 (+),score=186.89 GCRY01000540.1:115-2814(+)